jgi:FKBP-type peptidyl-prolyl cis-trans isomerase
MYIVKKSSDGKSHVPGDTVTVHYTGTLLNGSKFDSSVDKGTPFSFVVGKGSVIPGFDEGIMMMKVGGKVLVSYAFLPGLWFRRRTKGRNSTL